LPLEEETDAQLVARARADDTDAFRSLLERYQPMAFHLALRMVGKEEVAHELVQEALLQAYLSLDHLRDDARFKSWLYGIVLNLCRNWCRLHPASELSLDSQATSFEHPLTDDPQEIAEERELEQAVRSAIRILTPNNYAVAFLFYYKDMSMQEIADRLSISIPAVKNRLHKARQQIQAHLETRYADLVVSRQSPRRRKTMLRLHFFKIVQRHQDLYESTYLLFLDEKQRNAWTPFVSDWRTQTFHRSLPTSQATTDVEPATGEVLVQMIHALEGRVEEMSIEELYEDLLYARVTLHGRLGRQTVKARLDDALRLAIREQPAVFIDETVFENQAITLADYGQTQEQQLATIEQLIKDAPYLLQSRARPDNLDFSRGTRGWTFHNVRGALDTHVTRKGKPTLALTVQQEESWSSSIILGYRSFRPGEYSGKRVRATAYLKAQGVPQPVFTMALAVPFPLPAGISDVSDWSGYVASSETMQIVETQEWTSHSLIMDIPQDTYQISFSLSHRGQGNGIIWLGDIELETVDDSVTVTDTSITSLLLQPFNLDFAHGLSFWQVKGEAVWHYERGIDTTTTADGSPSAFLKSISAESAGPCTLQQQVEAQHYWGKSLQLSAGLKTTSARRVHFFIKHWLGDGTGVEEIITGTTTWTEYRLTLPIAVGAPGFVFGVTLDGPGQCWLNNIQFQVAAGDL
jgi:RNA polymerase sigma factor (sigma-70 family)